jgi:hypothetical protein
MQRDMADAWTPFSELQVYRSEPLARMLLSRGLGPIETTLVFFLTVSLPLTVWATLVPGAQPPDGSRFTSYFANVSWSISMLVIFPFVVGLSVKYFQEIPKLFADLATSKPPSRSPAEYEAFRTWLSFQFNRRVVPLVLLLLTLILNVVYYYQILKSEPDQSWITNGPLLRGWFGLPAGLSYIGAFSAVVQASLIYWMGNLAWKSFVLAWGLHRYFNTEHLDVNVDPLHVDGCCGLRRIGDVSMIFNGIMFLIGMYLSLKVIDKMVVQHAALASDIGNPVLLGCYALFVPALFFLPLGAAHRRMREAKEEFLWPIADRYRQLILDVAPPRSDVDYATIEKIRALYKDLERQIPVWPFNFRSLQAFFGTIVVPVVPVVVPLVVQFVGKLLKP